jgi:predicted nucleotidyltransferase
MLGLEEIMADSLEQQIARAVEVLKAAGAREVYVFGSAARPRGVPPRDVDLAVSGLPPHLFFRAYGAAGDELDLPLDLLDLDDDNPVVRYLKEEGELIRVG